MYVQINKYVSCIPVPVCMYNMSVCSVQYRYSTGVYMYIHGTYIHTYIHECSMYNSTHSSTYSTYMNVSTCNNCVLCAVCCVYYPLPVPVHTCTRTVHTQMYVVHVVPSSSII